MRDMTRILLAIGALCAAGEARAGDAPLSPPDLPLRYINPPGMTRDLNSLAACEQTWIPTVHLHAASSSRNADVATQLAAAFSALDRELADHHARRHAIVRLDVSVRATQGDIALPVDAAFKTYFQSRMGSMEGPDGGIDYPVRTVIGVHDLPDQSDVALDAEIVDRDNIDIAYLVDPQTRKQAARGKRVLFGGIGSTSLPPGREGADRLVAQLRQLLAAGGTRLGDIATLTAYVNQAAPDAGQDWPGLLRASFEASGAGAVPLSVTPVSFADRAGQALVLEGEARTDAGGKN